MPAARRVLDNAPLQGAYAETGFGYVIVHQGADGFYIIETRWIEGYMSTQRIFVGSLDQPESLLPPRPDLAPCVWEHVVIEHESRVYREFLRSSGMVSLAEARDQWRNDVVCGTY